MLMKEKRTGCMSRNVNIGK